MLALLAVLISPAPELPPAAFRWWDRGHHAVAALAWSRLSAEARARASTLLAGDDFVQVSTWADSVRPHRRETAPWHYVNIAIWEPRYDPDRHCPEGNCVIGAIERFRAVLSDPDAPSGARGEALRFLIHFVGDIHQPLHAGDRSDRGGNDTRVTLNGRETSLHAIWDGAVVERLAPTEPGLIARLQARLDALPEEMARDWGDDPVLQWALEGQAIAKDHAYRLPADGAIDSRYLDDQREVVETALLKAGVRLAALLEAALTPRAGPGASPAR